MAEEKKTTKKVTKEGADNTEKKKHPTENVVKESREEKTEVKTERKFCTNCGKELKDGEVCHCRDNQTATPSAGAESLKNFGKKFLNTFTNMFKKPYTTVLEEAEERNVKFSLIVLAFIAISYGLYIIASFTSNIGLFGTFFGENINNIIDIPYLKIFLYVTIINYIVAFIPMAVTYIISKIFGGHNFDFKKSISLYVTAMIPTIATNLLMAVFYYLNILTWVALIVGLIVNVICLFHYIIGFIELTQIRNERKAYALTGLTVVWVIVQVVVIVIMLLSFFKDIIPDFSIQDDYYNNSGLRW